MTFWGHSIPGKLFQGGEPEMSKDCRSNQAEKREKLYLRKVYPPSLWKLFLSLLPRESEEPKNGREATPSDTPRNILKQCHLKFILCSQVINVENPSLTIMWNLCKNKGGDNKCDVEIINFLVQEFCFRTKHSCPACVQINFPEFLSGICLLQCGHCGIWV